jgi:glycosyltransferase involved in cell wall biosynthesis
MAEFINKKKFHVVFLHLDLGIGGAEQLMVNLALASSTNTTNTGRDDNSSGKDYKDTSLNGNVSIFTTHCNQNHCFDAVRKTCDPPGKLASSVHLVGTFLPVTIFGKGTAFCSTIRMLYLSISARRMYPEADVIVLDVLPSPIPYLVLKSKCVIYYCHFPDKLLTRDTINGEQLNASSRNGVNIRNALKNLYRSILDRVEEWTMSYADLICVNSNFTRNEVLRAFPTLNSKHDCDKMQVLYPAIDLSKFIPPDFELKRMLTKKAANGARDEDAQMPVVSLNRFERKKNITVLLHAYASIQNNFKENDKQPPVPLVIAGGYDPRNTENVEYLKELKDLASTLGIRSRVKFRPSVSDNERAVLLQSAICVVYTPHREHFGIVPLEAMYAGSAVVAMRSGGPKETILDGVTGVLVDMKLGDNCDALAIAIKDLLDDPKKAIKIGERGHDHVKEKFGLEPFRKEWKRLVLDEGIPRGQRRLKDRSGLGRVMFFMTYAVILAAWYLVRYLLAGSTQEWTKSYRFE